MTYNMIRKFYNADATEASASTKFELGEPIELTEVFDGQKAASEEVKQEPQEEKQEVQVEQQAPVVEESKQEVVNEVAPVINWKDEAIKNKKELFPLLGIDEDTINLSRELAQDEFLKKAIIYRKENGNLTPFIEAATKDWDKISHDQLVMDDLKKQYSKSLSPEKAEKLAKSEFNKRFSFKEDELLSEEENAELAELNSIKLESEGERIRNERKAEQKQFMDSVKPIDRNAEIAKISKEREESDRKEFEAFKNQIESSPVMAKLFSDKKIVIGANGNSFNYTVNPDAIKEQTLDTNKFYGQFWDGDKFNQEKWNRVAAYSLDPLAYDAALINHGRSLGTKDIVEKELENADDKNRPQPNQVKAKSLAKAFAEGGETISMESLGY